MRLTRVHPSRSVQPAAGLVALAFLVAASLPQRAGAQTLYGSLVGNVTDPSGAAVPGATITVTQRQTQLTRTVTADPSGGYKVATLSAGTYDIKISASGFRTFEKTGVTVDINSVERVDAVLELGAMTQTVEVNATAHLLQTETPDVHHDLTATTIENVPMPPGNNFEELFRAMPGFNPPISAHSVATNPSRSLQFNVNGASSYGNDVRIDGMSQYNIWVPENVAYIPSSDAIQVVNVATNSFNPEQGLAGGSSINVQIKSGTNQLHGDVYEYHYDNGIEARPYFFYGRNPKDIFNQFGGSVGGPIKEDKLFYFANVEGTRQRQFATALATVPTLAMRSGDLRGLDLAKPNPDVVYDPTSGDSNGNGRTQISCNGALNEICPDRISPVAAKILSMLPLPTPGIVNASSTVPSNNFLGAADVAFNRLTSDSKIDWNATNKFTMFGHLGLADYNTRNPQIFAPIGGPQASGFIGNEGRAYGHTISFSVSGNYVATPNFVVDGNFGMTRMVANSQQLDLDKKLGTDVLGIPGTNGTRRFEGSWPEFEISSFSVIGTQHNFMPYFRNDPQFNYSSNATWIKGRHSFRFGADIIAQHLNQQQPEWNGGGSSYGPQGGFLFGNGPTQCKTTATNDCGQPSLAKGKTTASNAYNSFATFLLGLDTAYGKNIQVPDFFHTITHEYGLYAGDQWQVTSKLTATLGVRWEYFPIPTRGGSRGLERFDFAKNETMLCGVGGIPTDCGVSVSKANFAPRVGLAYRAANTFVVRAGYGITYEPYNLVDDLRTNYPILIPLYVTPPTSLLAAGLLDSASLQNAPAAQTLPVGIPLPANPSLNDPEIPIPGNVAAATAGSSLKRGYIQTWNFTMEKEFRGGWLAQAGYVASRTINQLGILNLNVGSPVLPAGCTPGNCGGNASLPFGFDALTNTPTTNCPSGFASTAPGCRTAVTSIITPIANNHYDSLQASLNHHFAQGYQVQINYTWSKTIGMAGVENEKNSPEIQNLSFYNLNRGLAPIHRPQNFEAVFIAESPFGTRKRWASTGIGSRILGGWQLSSLISAVSGSVLRVTADGSSLNAAGNTQRPDLVKPSVKITGNVGPGTAWFDTTAFAGVSGSPLAATDQRFGTSSFYPLLGPGVFNMDAGVSRNFRLSERFNLQVRAQAINLTNTPHFANPSSSHSSCGSFNAKAGLPCDNASFGQVDSTTNLARDGIDQRQFEFSLRLMF